MWQASHSTYMYELNRMAVALGLGFKEQLLHPLGTENDMFPAHGEFLCRVLEEECTRCLGA